MLASVAGGLFPDLDSAGFEMIRYESEIVPNAAWSERYQKLRSLFYDLYRDSEKFWDRFESEWA